ncbi:hypothetical protein [Planococcus ruber]|uniref:hypothetical protein n=1 Tax=Planococcus ruber TaxID=2027871 RepID=UPI001FEE6363|nr:hypothetical protein [Planococcus ruber]MCJ1907451.1 hypothetical protein [Planococcus ruber]
MIDAYRKLWKNRAGVLEIETDAQLEQAIRIELNDELTHPRIRKPVAEKLAFAAERIGQSDLAETEKAQLLDLYKKIAAQLG